MPNFLIFGSLFLGGAIGFAIAWYIKNRELVIERLALRELKEREAELGSHFEVIANKVLRDRSDDFFKSFNQAREQHEVSVGNKERGFSNIAESVEKTIRSVEGKLAELEKQKNQQIGELRTSIQNVLSTGEKMHESAQSLKTVLSSASAVRGRWGETTLKNLLEESGLQEGTDFETQSSMIGDESAILRPDVVINLPGKLRLAVDSKAGLEEFFKACEEKDEVKKKEHIAKFSQNLRTHIKALSGKEYQKHLDGRIPYVIMFVPGEAAVRAVFEQDVNLYREAQERKVMLASPATIMPLILLIAHAWRQHKSVENATKLAEEVMDLGSRLKVFTGHVMGIGSHISQATKKFNQAAGSWDTMIATKLEKIRVLGGNIHLEMEQMQAIEEEPRAANKLLEEESFPKGKKTEGKKNLKTPVAKAVTPENSEESPLSLL